jgi:radical SAM-linked protein
MMFPSALGLGVAALDEVMEVELAEHYDADEVLSRLRRHTVAGLEFHSVEVLAAHQHKGQVQSVVYEFQVPEERRAKVAGLIDDFMAEEACLVTRPQRTTPVDIRRDVERLELAGGHLRMRLGMARDASVRPRDVLAVLGLADLEQQGSYLTRTSVQLQMEEVS